MRSDLISAWFPASFLNLFTLLQQIQEELSKKTGLNDSLHEKFGEMADSIIKLRLMFGMLRYGGMPQRTENALSKQFTKMDKIAADVCMCYICSVVLKTTSHLEEKVNDLIKFCERQQTLQGVPCN